MLQDRFPKLQRLFEKNKSRRSALFAAIICGLQSIAVLPISGQNRSCSFDPATGQFAGSPVEQAKCLLRTNSIGGRLVNQPVELPKGLERIIGREVRLSRERLRQYLKKQSINEADLGGSLDDRLSEAKLPNGNKVSTMYFVIHDTSSPYLGDAEFAAGMDNDPEWKGNNLNVWIDQPVAHVFVDRLGRSITTTPFSEPVKKGWGTKFARDVLKADAKGIQLHIELIQPRRRDPADPNPKNDRIAPLPGFTKPQYQRLALLYVCASLRRGTWLIPAYHAAIDAGIKDAHDDPQNFDLKLFAAELFRLIKKEKR